MASWSEQKARDRLLDAFIDTDPINIDLQRPVQVASGAGGLVDAGVIAIGPQEFMVYPFKRRLTQEYRFTPQTFGEDRVEYIHYILIFRRDLDIALGDTFDPSTDISPTTDRLEPGKYEVAFVSARSWDRSQAGVLYRG
jgi:hypothetical protein